jgi:hypothetical protein
VSEPRIDVGRSAKAIEWLKAELAAGVGEAFRELYRGREDDVLDALAEVVLTCYLLARRAGAPFARLDLRLESLCRANIVQEHQLERWYADMSALAGHIEGRRGETA